jgi:hypothetical protein
VSVRPPAPVGAGDEERMAPGGDRVSLRLSAADEALIAATAAVCDHVVVVVVGGSAVVMPWASNVSAILMTWYSGVEGGSALADVLAGDAEPTGRLPFVVPTDPDHLAYFDRDATEITYDLFHGQWKLDRDGHAAHFPFGWGLGWGEVDVVGAATVDTETITVTIRNPGGRPVRAAVFAHAGLPVSEWERPRRRLVGFGRADVGAGASATIELELDWSMLDVRAGGDWLTEHGTYVIEVGRYAGDPEAATIEVHR